jgi:hypothetical protein
MQVDSSVSVFLPGWDKVISESDCPPCFDPLSQYLAVSLNCTVCCLLWLPALMSRTCYLNVGSYSCVTDQAHHLGDQRFLILLLLLPGYDVLFVSLRYLSDTSASVFLPGWDKVMSESHCSPCLTFWVMIWPRKSVRIVNFTVYCLIGSFLLWHHIHVTSMLDPTPMSQIRYLIWEIWRIIILLLLLLLGADVLFFSVLDISLSVCLILLVLYFYLGGIRWCLIWLSSMLWPSTWSVSGLAKLWEILTAQFVA